MKKIFDNLYKKIYCQKTKLINKMNNISDVDKRIYRKTFLCSAIFCMILFGCNLFFADYSIDSSSAESSFRNIFNSVYAQVMGVATLIAVSLIAYNILIIMTSKNQKKIDLSYTWIKAIAISWVFLMLISIFITMIKQASGYKKVIKSGTGPLFKY